MPRLLVNLSNIRRNAEAICRLCTGRGISVAGVVKGACGALPVARAVLEGGCAQLASSRLSQLEGIRAALPRQRPCSSVCRRPRRPSGWCGPVT